MDPLNLFAILIWIIVISKIIAHWIRVVDVLMYIVLGFLASKFWIIEWNSEIIHFLSEIWVLFLMFYAGWHEDSKTFLRKVIDNKWIAIIWAIWPFIWAYLWIKILWFSFNESVVAWFVFTATAVPYTIAVLQSLKLDKTEAAKSIVAAAMADDFISIISMSAVFSTFVLIQSGQNVIISDIVIWVILKLSLLLLCFTVFIFLAKVIFPEKKLIFQNSKWIKKLISSFVEVLWLKWFTKKFHHVEILVPTVIFIMLFLATFSHIMWLHAAIWAYLTGLILDPEMFHDEKKESGACNTDYSGLTWVIYSLANHFLGPIFFISLWAQLVIDFGNFTEIFKYSFILFLFVAVSQFVSAYYASRYTVNLSHKDSVLVWFWMWPRDILAFVILGIAITYSLIEKDSIFGTVIVLTIILLDISAPLFMKWWSKKY